MTVCCGETEWQAQKQMAGPIKFDKHCVSERHTKNVISFVLAFKRTWINNVILQFEAVTDPRPSLLDIVYLPGSKLHNTNQIFFQSVWRWSGRPCNFTFVQRYCKHLPFKLVEAICLTQVHSMGLSCSSKFHSFSHTCLNWLIFLNFWSCFKLFYRTLEYIYIFLSINFYFF